MFLGKYLSKRKPSNTIRLEFFWGWPNIACRGEIRKYARGVQLAEAAFHLKLTLRRESVGFERD